MRLVLVTVVLACLLVGVYAPPPATTSTTGTKSLQATGSKAQRTRSTSIVRPSKPKFGPVELKAGSGTLALKFEWSTTDNFAGWSVLIVAKDTEQPIYRRVFGDVSDESFWKPTTKISKLTASDIEAALREVPKNSELREVAEELTLSLKSLKEGMETRGEGPAKEGGKETDVVAQQSEDDKKSKPLSMPSWVSLALMMLL